MDIRAEIKKAFKNDYDFAIKMFRKWAAAIGKEADIIDMKDWAEYAKNKNIQWDHIDRFDRCDSYVDMYEGYVYSTDSLYDHIDYSSSFDACIKYYANLVETYKELATIPELAKLFEKPKEPEKLLNYSFCSKGNCTKEEIKALIDTTDKPFVYTVGLEYRGPTIHRKHITREEAISIYNKDDQLEITEEKYCVHLNELTANDMW